MSEEFWQIISSYWANIGFWPGCSLEDAFWGLDHEALEKKKAIPTKGVTGGFSKPISSYF